MEKIDLKAELVKRRLEIEQIKRDEQNRAVTGVKNDVKRITEVFKELVHNQVSNGFLVVEQFEQLARGSVSIQVIENDDSKKENRIDVINENGGNRFFTTRTVYTIATPMYIDVTDRIAFDLVGWLHETYNLDYRSLNTKTEPSVNQSVYTLHWDN